MLNLEVIDKGYEEVECPMDDLEISSFEGYKTNLQTEMNAFHYLSQFGYDKAFEELKQKYTYIAILKSLYVNEDYRNDGYGSELLEVFLDEVYDVEAVILIADELEDNDFDLVKWYERNDFHIVDGHNSKFPLMVLDLKEE